MNNEKPSSAENIVRLRSGVAGKRVCIVHYVEHTPFDTGYRPARHGQLAQWLTAAGAEVTRFVPTFSHFTKEQRPLQWSGRTSDEGTVHMIPTRAYPSNRDRRRIGFIADLGRGAANAVRELPPFDLFIVGYPPPGIVRSIHRASGGNVPIIADIRDLWPDTLVPSDKPALQYLGRVIGRALANELRFTTGVVAMSQTMLHRAPRVKRLRSIPLGISDAIRQADNRIDPDAGLVVSFVGSFSPLFDFDSLFAGWKLFVEDLYSDRAQPVLRVFGAGEFQDHVEQLAVNTPHVNYVGWVNSSDIPRHLAETDVGVAPTRTGQGTTLSNKILEYLGSGAFVLHSLEAANAGDLAGLGLWVESTPSGWANGFAEAEQRLAELRATRLHRREQALHRFGQEGVEPLWLTEITRTLAGRA